MNAPLSRDALLSSIRALPSLPQAVLELNAALQSDDAPVDRIVNAVASDQALTLTALRIANSSFYGVSRRVVSLRDAVQVLGLHTLAAAVNTAAVMRCIGRPDCPGFDFDDCWRHAIATALCTRTLAQARGLDADAAYTAGLLHDIGRLVLAMHFAQPYSALLTQASLQDITPRTLEPEWLGMDHAEVGGLVAEHWHLAPVIVQAIGQHHEPPADGACSLLDLLHVADNITHALDLSQTANEMVPPISLDAWGRVDLQGPRLTTLFEQVETRMQGWSLGLLGGEPVAA